MCSGEMYIPSWRKGGKNIAESKLNDAQDLVQALELQAYVCVDQTHTQTPTSWERIKNGSV